MSDMFERTRRPHYRLRTADAVVVSDNEQAEEWPQFRFSHPPRGEPDADIDLRYRLERFRREEINVDIRIRNLLASGESVWEFRESLSGFEESYSGRNVEELKSIFDDLLRAVMKALSRRAS